MNDGTQTKAPTFIITARFGNGPYLDVALSAEEVGATYNEATGEWGYDLERTRQSLLVREGSIVAARRTEMAAFRAFGRVLWETVREPLSEVEQLVRDALRDMDAMPRRNPTPAYHTHLRRPWWISNSHD